MHSRLGNGSKRYHLLGVIPLYFRRIRDLREDNDYTQIEIAARLHMQRNVYRRYELGEREIPTWAVIELAKLYKCSTDYLLGLTDRPERNA